MKRPLQWGLGILGAPATELLRLDVWVQDRWRLARTATAIAGYQAEHGRSPGSLQELVPDWLSELPRSPYSGFPIRYENGRVISPGIEIQDGAEWSVHRKTP